tara:strand:- start:975 stop:1364 length:390 start_codon:yes stop_codon:yes gene_type:complete
MSDKLNIEIITPDQTILKSEATEVTIPSFEGQMGILKNHIPLITFLRPGIISVKQDQIENKFFVEEGTVEFSKNNLLILTSTVKDLKNLEKKSINYLIKQAEDKLKNNSLSDKEKYVASYKIESLKELI